MASERSERIEELFHAARDRDRDERTKWFRKSPRLAGIQKDPRFQQIIDSVESRRTTSHDETRTGER